MPFAAAAAVAGSVITGAMASDASSSAADKQKQAADEANQIQREQNELNQKNFQPYLDAGGLGLNALTYRLGLGGSGAGGGGAAKTEADIRAELAPQYTTAANPATPPSLDSLPQVARQQIYMGNGTYGYDAKTGKYGFQYDDNQGGDNSTGSKAWYYTDQDPATNSAVDQSGLDAAVAQRLQQQQEAANAQANDPNYGSLLDTYKPYQEYKPYEEYTAAKFQEGMDPGYQFRVDQGNQAIQRAAAAAGGLNSGRAAKDLVDYNSGQASQEFNNAFNRYNTGYTTGLTGHINDYTTGFNAFNTNQANQFNKLSTIAGMGQASAANLAGVNQNYANQVGNNLNAGANAQAAGIVGSQNAINQGIGGATNSLTSYLNQQQPNTSLYGAPSNQMNGSMFGDASSRVEGW